MARELDERELSRLENHRDAASSASDASDLYSSELSGRPVEDGPYSGSDEPVCHGRPERMISVGHNKTCRGS